MNEGTTDRSEKQYYEAFYRNAPIGLFTVTFEGRFLKVNPEMAKIFEATDEGLLAINALDLFDFSNLVTACQEETIVKNRTMAAATTKGTRKYISVSAQLCGGFCKSSGDKCLPNCPQTRCIEGFVEDITEKKMFENQIEKMKQEQIRLLQQIQSRIDVRLRQFET